MINPKHEILNSKQIQMTKTQNSKQYNLEERTLKFSQSVISYIKKLDRNITSIEIAKQLIRATGSIGANYIEANESLSKKDFIMRIKICRKEAKECRYWLVLTEPRQDNFKQKNELISEVTELMKIFGSILEKSK